MAGMNYEPGSIANDGVLSLPGEEGPTRRRRWAIIVAIVVVALAIAVWAFARSGGGKAGDDGADKKAQVPTITVTVPGRAPVAQTISATGTLAARIDMPVGVAGEGGMVRQVLVQPGDWVRQGQLLARIDRSVQVQTGESLAAQIRVAQADADLASSELERARQLVDRGFISKADLDRKAATRDSALARVRVARAQLAETQARTARLDIRAPASGLVLTRNVEPGQVVSPGSGTLFRIAKDGEMELRAAMGESDLTSVAVNNSAVVTPIGSQEHVAGHIWQLSPVIDPQTRQGIARIALPYSTALRPGGFAQAEITGGIAQVPLLPQSAVQSDDKANYVYVVLGNNTVARRDIKVGQVSDAGVAIAQGLNGNERVVVSAGAFLNPGQKVTPVMAKKARS